MAQDVRISISCPDRTGLLAVVTARLFDLGGSLRDTSFAVLGESAELTAVCELPDAVSAEDVKQSLCLLSELEGADVDVVPFRMKSTRAPSGQITNRVEFRGKDRPGLVARLAEAFAEFGANVVRMDSQQVTGGDDAEYVMRFEVHVPSDREEACVAAVSNTAEGMGLAAESYRV